MSGMLPGGSRAWRVYLGLGLLTVLAYLLLPLPGVRDGIFGALAVSAVVAIVIAVRANRTDHPGLWYLFAAGQLMTLAGDAGWLFYERVLDANPFASPLADVLYLSAYPLIAGGLLLLTRRRTPGGVRSGFVDATIVSTGLGLLAWVFLIEPYVRDNTLTLLERAVSISYPVADVLLLAVLIRLLLAPGPRPASYYLLTLSLVSLLASDMLFGASELTGTYENGPGDAGWLLSYALWGTAALHPSMSRLSAPASQTEVKLSRARLALLTGASFMSPAVLAIQAIRQGPIDVPVIVVGSVVMFSLVLIRVEGLLHSLSKALAERRRTEEALRESEECLRTVVSNVPVVLFAMDREGTLILAEGKGLEDWGSAPKRPSDDR